MSISTNSANIPTMERVPESTPTAQSGDGGNESGSGGGSESGDSSGKSEYTLIIHNIYFLKFEQSYRIIS